jgi:hypothetical protein
VHGAIQQLAIKKGQCDDIASGRQHLVQQSERLHGAGVELVGSGHALETRVAVADIVADHRQPQQHRLVVLLVTSHGQDLVIRALDVGPIHADVLVIIVVAAVSISQLSVDTRYALHPWHRVLVRTLTEVVVAGAPRARRLVELVLGVLQKLVHVPPVGGQPLWRAAEERVVVSG